MKMTKGIAIIWILLTAVPFLYILFFSTLMVGDTNLSHEEYREQFDIIHKFHLAIILWMWGLTATYIVYIFKTSYVPADKKSLWAVVLFFANLFAMPFFWFYYVWKPLLSEHDKNNLTFRKDKTPIIIGLLIFLLIPLSMMLTAYREGNSYQFLSNKFPLLNELSTNEIPITSVSITKSQRVHGAIRLKDIMNLYFFENSIAIQAKYPYSYFYKSFELKNSDIHSCSKQCGGSTDYILILDELDTQIRMEGTPELIEWCWSNKIPMLSSKMRREWLYNGEELSNNNLLMSQQTNHEDYLYQAKQSCLGY